MRTLDLARGLRDRLLRGVSNRTGCCVLAGALAAVVFCTYYQRWVGQASFSVPVAYFDRGDAMYTLGVSKAFSGFPAPFDLQIPELNAPFGADWNDYPHTEKLVFYTCGLLRRFFGAGEAANLVLLLCHALSAVAFAWTAHSLGSRPIAALAFALIYAFNPFSIGRGLGHLNIAYVWHIPPLLYLVRWVARDDGPLTLRGWLAAAALMIATSFQNPYYTIIALQLLMLASLRAWLTGRRRMARFGLAMIAVTVVSFLANQLNVYLRAWTDGPNAAFSGRSLGAIMNWGLRIPDLFLPRVHPISAWSEYASTHYFEAGNPGTENGYAFLGIVGCVALLALCAVAIVRGLANRGDSVPWQAWILAYVLLFALAGGLNYFLGAMGMTWLRAANRYSIVILCGALLFGCEVMSALRRPALGSVIAAGVGAVALLEVFAMRPPDFAVHQALLTRVTASDREFSRSLESRLPAGAAVFQLPVVPFPEAPSIHRMIDYEQFRPYLWTASLRFSYGAHKGREREEWQRRVSRLKPAALTEYLGSHGFDAVVINRRGYEDGAQALESELQGTEGPLSESSERDLVAYRIDRTGSKRPKTYATVALAEGFPWGWENDSERRWAWSNGRASLRFLNSPTSGRRYRIRMSVETLVERELVVRIGDQVLASVELVPGKGASVAIDWVAREGEKHLVLDTNRAAERPSNGDSRLLGFRVIDPVVEER